MVEIKKLLLRFSLIIVTFFLLMFLLYYFALFSPDFFKIPFDNFLMSIYFTNLNKLELVLLLFIISILFVFSDNRVLNLKNRIRQNRIFQIFFSYHPFLSLFLLTIGFFIAFLATLIKNSFFIQIGILIFDLGLLGFILIIHIIYQPESRLIPFFVHHPYMRHVYILMIFVITGFLVYRLGIDYLKVSVDTAYNAGITVFVGLTAGYMGYMGLVRR